MPAADSGAEPSLAAINARFATLIAQLRITRAAQRAAQRQTDAKVDAQDVRLTTIQGQLDEAQQRLLDTVKITAAQQLVIRRAIDRIGKRYEKSTGKAIYDLLNARFCAELGTTRCQRKSMGKPWTGCAHRRRSIYQMIRARSHHCRRVCTNGRSTE